MDTDTGIRLIAALAGVSTAAEFGELAHRHPECLSDDFRLGLVTVIESLRADDGKTAGRLEQLLALLDDCSGWGVTEILPQEFANNPGTRLPAPLSRDLGRLLSASPAAVSTEAWTELLARPDVAGCPPELRNELLNSMGARHLERYRAVRDPDALKVAIDAYREVVGDEPDAAPGRVRITHLSNLATAHLERFQLTRDRADLDVAVGRFREALRQTPPRAAARVPILISAAAAAKERYRLASDPADLADAFRWCGEAVSTVPQREELLLGLYHQLECTRLLDRYQDGSATEIASPLAAVAFCMEYKPYPSGQLSMLYRQLGDELVIWYRLTDDPAPFDVALRCYDHMVAHSGTGSASRLEALERKCVALAARYERAGSQDDADTAIDGLRQCSRRAPAGSRLSLVATGNLAGTLLSRYEVTHADQDLAEAVELLDDAVQRAGNDQRERPAFLVNLAKGLRLRWSSRMAGSGSACCRNCPPARWAHGWTLTSPRIAAAASVPKPGCRNLTIRPGGSVTQCSRRCALTSPITWPSSHRGQSMTVLVPHS